MNVEAPHLLAWRALHESIVVDARESEAFAEVLNSLQWNISGMRLDWLKIIGIEIDLDDPNAAQLLGRSRLAAHSHTFLLYSPAQPGLVVRTDAIIEHLDELYWKSAGINYLCGAEVDAEGQVVFAFQDFAEYDGFAKLTARV
jgi:hypothetical protein